MTAIHVEISLVKTHVGRPLFLRIDRRDAEHLSRHLANEQTEMVRNFHGGSQLCVTHTN